MRSLRATAFDLHSLRLTTRRSPGFPMRFVIKWRFLLKLAVLLIVGAVVLHFTHRWQVRRQVGAFLYQADQAHELVVKETEAGNETVAQGQREREILFLKRYVIARPDDIDVRDRLGRLIAQSAQTRKQRMEAFLILEDILRRDENRDDLRKFTIDFAMSPGVGLYKEAKGHIETLLKKSPPNRAELETQWGICWEVEHDFKKAAEHYDESIRLNPDQIAPYFRLAVAKRRQNEVNSIADRPIVEMIARNKENASAYIAAVRYLGAYGLDKLPVYPDIAFPALTQEELVQEALKRDGKDLSVLLAAAKMAQARGRKLAGDPLTRAKAPQAIQEARDFLTKAVQEHPKSPDPYLARAALEAEQRQVSEAIKVIQEGLTKLPESVELSLGLLQYQFDGNDAVGATSTLDKLRARGLSTEIYEYESARLLVLQEKWMEAVSLLESAIEHLKPEQFGTDQNKSQKASDRIRQATLLLGYCYAEMGENQRRFEAYTRALPLESAGRQWIQAMVGIAEAELSLGRTDDALKTYRDLSLRVPSVLINVARLQLRRAIETNPAKPDCSRVEDTIESAEKIAAAEPTAYLIPDTTEFELLRATMENTRAQPAKARKILEALREKRPENVAVRIELALQAARERKLPEARSALDAVEKEFGDSPELRMARARVYAVAKKGDVSAQLLTLAEKTEKFSVAQKRRLFRELAEIASQAGADQAATRLWDSLADAKPFDLSVQLVRFDRAARARDLAAMRNIVPLIEKIDGVNGQSARLTRAICEIQDSQAKNERAPRDHALRELESLEREQGVSPAPGVLTAEALVHDLNGDTRRAIEKYRLAIQRGEHNISVVLRLVELLRNSGTPSDLDEALALLDRLQAETQLGTDFQKLAAELALRADSRKKALEYAKRAVPESSTNYKEQIWLGDIYAGVNDPEKPAVDRFRCATELAPDEMDAWVALVHHLAANKSTKDEAAKTFERAKDKVKKADQAYFVALGQLELGETAKAIEAFKQARTERPNDVRILLAEADFLMQVGRLADARAGFEHVLKMDSSSKGEKGFARQRLARAMAADPDYSVSKEAVKLIEMAPGGNESPAERRTRAAILGMQKDRASKLEAIRLFEESKDEMGPTDKFMLAQLHAIVGNKRQVGDVMSSLLKPEKNQIPLYVQFYARWLIREKRFDLAAAQIQQLDIIDPNSLSTAELKARLAMHNNDPARARAALMSKANEPNAPVGYIARVCEDIKLYDEAEQLFKKFIELNKSIQPGAVLAIAAYYGRRGRTQEGLRICDEYRGKLPWTTIGPVVVGILYDASRATSADMARAATWFDEAAKKAPGNDRAAMLQLLAAVRNLEGDYDAAIQLYKDVLSANPRDALAMNNLAYLLSAHKRDHEAGRGLIEQAKQIVGPINTLLDTEALIWMEMKQPERAVKLLQDVVAEAPSGSGYFHLARAELALAKGGDESKAKSAWQQAKDLGLKAGDLHPLERNAHAAMMEKWKSD